MYYCHWKVIIIHHVRIELHVTCSGKPPLLLHLPEDLPLPLALRLAHLPFSLTYQLVSATGLDLELYTQKLVC